MTWGTTANNGTFITKRDSFRSGDGQFNTPRRIDEDEIKKKCVRKDSSI
ncbi:MAG: hypothetical protein WA220_09830 [Candidatus Nitrosopolaris sp.]